MTGDLLDVRAINDQFVFCDAHWQQFSDALPGHGIEVLQIGDIAIRVHGAVQDPGGIVRPRGQSEQMRLLFFK